MTWPMNDITITFLVLAAVVVFFVWTGCRWGSWRWVGDHPVGDRHAQPPAGARRLRRPDGLFIASLFVVSEALDCDRGHRVGRPAGDRARGDRRTRLLRGHAAAGRRLTALISVNGAVAALIPIVVVMAIRELPTSQLLMPLAFAAHAGSMLALTGTPGEHHRVRRGRGRRARRLRLLRVRARRRAARRRHGRHHPAVRATLLPSDHGDPAADLGDHAGALRRAVRRLERPARWCPHGGREPRSSSPPRSPLIGQSALPGDGHRQRRPRDAGRAARGRPLDGPDETCCAAGDALLLQGTWEALDKQLDATPRCWWSTTRTLLRRRRCRSARRAAGDRDPRRDGRAARHRRRARAVAGLLAACAVVLPGRAHRDAGVPRHFVDDGRAGRRDDPAVDRVPARPARRRCRRLAAVVGSATPGPARCCSACSCSPSCSGR